MKVCPNCQQQYTDDDLNFCLNDGGVLTQMTDDAPPTVLLNQARTTNQNYSNIPDPFTPWQNQPLQQQQQNTPFQQQNQAFMPPRRHGGDQTLPTLALIFGILSFVFTCCYGGFYFGIAATIIGYIGMNNANNNPDLYGGKGLAIAGMVLGAVSFIGTLIFILLVVAGNIS
jgi:hypothetical protein